MKKLSLIEELRPKIDGAKVISFDIFDTLVLRNYAKPTDLFRHIGESLGLAEFAEARINAEQQAREKAFAKGIEEVSLDQIYEALPQKYRHCKEHEISLEKRACHANPEMKAVFDYCVENKKRVVIIVVQLEKYASIALSRES